MTFNSKFDPPSPPLKFQGASFELIKFFWKKIFRSWFSGSERKFWKFFWSVSISQVQWSFLSFLISRFPLFNTRYRDLGQNCPKVDATTTQIKADATINFQDKIMVTDILVNFSRSSRLEPGSKIITIWYIINTFNALRFLKSRL